MQYNVSVETLKADDSTVNHNIIIESDSFMGCIYKLAGGFGIFRGMDAENSSKTKRVYKFEHMAGGSTLHISTATVEQIGKANRKITVTI
jgi:hypothetical protein